jgi:hypothetical protein
MNKMSDKMRKSITTIFMVPTLKIGIDTLKENGFINAFIKDKINPEKHEDCIFLVFHPESPSKFRKFLNLEYDRTNAIIYDYDCPNGFVVVVYKLDPKFENDFLLIRQSKYSKTSPLFKAQFPEKVEVEIEGEMRKEFSLQYRIFNKTQDLIDYWSKENFFIYKTGQEIWYNFSVDSEVLTEIVLQKIFWDLAT